MIENKYITAIVSIIVAAALCFCIVFMCMPQETDTNEKVYMEYEQLFDSSSVMEINITMDENAFSDMLKKASSEEYAVCSVSINGEEISNVAIRPKGNTSLSFVESMGSDRYSFKIEFDHYIEQTFKGLDKLVLNNCYADATMMKEYLTYDMFSYLGTDSSLFSFAKVSVNGEYFGLYLALEAVEESFMQRNYGSDYGDLYKPDSMGFGGRGGMMGADMNEITDMFKQKSGEETSDVQTISVSAVNGSSDMGNMPQNFDMSNMPQDFDMGNMPQDFDMGNMPQDFDMGNRPQDFDMGNRPQDFGMGEMPDTGKTQEDTQSQIRPDMGGRSFSKGDAGALNYIDDELSSYDEIWDASVFSSSDSDKRRVVTALENISNGSNIEEYMDVDNMLKYLAVQTYVVNLDGLAGSMAHNYYLSEIDGRLNLIPWDYNLAFGGFMSGDASQTVNFPIDTPFTSGLEQREFFAALLENEEYLSIYHGYLNELAQRYSGDSLERIVSAVEEEINYLVETDPTAFYTYEEYEEGVLTLKTVLQKRAESVLGQLSGTIPSTTSEQNQNSDLLVSTDGIDISKAGSMSFGGFDMGSFSKEDPSENRGNAKTEDVPQMGEMPQDFDISNIPENFDMSNIPDMGNMPGNNAQGAFIGQSFSREYIILFAVIGGAIVLSALVFKRKYNKGKKR